MDSEGPASEPTRGAVWVSNVVWGDLAWGEAPLAGASRESQEGAIHA